MMEDKQQTRFVSSSPTAMIYTRQCEASLWTQSRKAKGQGEAASIGDVAVEAFSRNFAGAASTSSSRAHSCSSSRCARSEMPADAFDSEDEGTPFLRE